MYFTDRGIEELEKRRGEEEVTFEWLAEQLRTFVDLNPDFEVPVERLATWLARLDDEDDEAPDPSTSSTRAWSRHAESTHLTPRGRPTGDDGNRQTGPRGSGRALSTRARTL